MRVSSKKNLRVFRDSGPSRGTVVRWTTVVRRIIFVESHLVFLAATVTKAQGPHPASRLDAHKYPRTGDRTSLGRSHKHPPSIRHHLRATCWGAPCQACPTLPMRLASPQSSDSPVNRPIGTAGPCPRQRMGCACEAGKELAARCNRDKNLRRRVASIRKLGILFRGWPYPPNDTGERPPPTSRVERTKSVQVFCSCQTDQGGGGSPRPAGSMLDLAFTLSEGTISSLSSTATKGSISRISGPD